MPASERGFALIETLVAAAIGFVLIWGLVALASRYAGWAASLNATLHAQTAAANLSERLASEASSAWAVFIPATGVLGEPNADGHELDFFTEDGAHRPLAWAYRYDRATKLVTRYSYAPGVAPQAGESTGPFDAFAATSVPASTIAADPLFSGATIPDVQYSFAAMPQAQGGNELVNVAIQAPGVMENDTLASAVAPTSFTVVLNYTPAPLGSTPTPGALPTLTPTP